MFDAFLKIDGIPSECTDDKHKDWIEVLSYSQGISQLVSSTASSAGGAGSGRCQHSDFVVLKALDKASPKIYEACCKGTHIKEVIVELCRAGGDKLKYMEIKMEQVIISNVSPSGNGKGNESIPSESLSFNYGKIKWTYTQQKRGDGSGGGNVTGGWDLTANKVFA